MTLLILTLVGLLVLSPIRFDAIQIEGALKSFNLMKQANMDIK